MSCFSTVSPVEQSIESPESEEPQSGPRTRNSDGPMTTPNSQPRHIESHISASSTFTFHTNGRKTPTEIQAQSILPEEPVKPHSNSSSERKDSESPQSSGPRIMLKKSCESNNFLMNETETRQQTANNFRDANAFHQVGSSMPASSSYVGENVKDADAVASITQLEALLPACKIQDGTSSFGASETAYSTFRSHEERELSGPTHVRQENESETVDESSPADPSVVQQQISSNDMQASTAVSNPQTCRDVDEKTYNPIFEYSEHEREVVLPIRRRQYPRPPGIKKKFHCLQCPDFFWTRGNRNRHLAKCHPRNRLAFPCENCSASFGTRTGKTIHEKGSS